MKSPESRIFLLGRNNLQSYLNQSPWMGFNDNYVTESAFNDGFEMPFSDSWYEQKP